jgi:ribosomal protein S21
MWRRLVETPGQRQQREALEEEERLRRVLAKIGYTPEEFEDAVQEFKRKFYAGDR